MFIRDLIDIRAPDEAVALREELASEIERQHALARRAHDVADRILAGARSPARVTEGLEYRREGARARIMGRELRKLSQRAREIHRSWKRDAKDRAFMESAGGALPPEDFAALLRSASPRQTLSSDIRALQEQALEAWAEMTDALELSLDAYIRSEFGRYFPGTAGKADEQARKCRQRVFERSADHVERCLSRLAMLRKQASLPRQFVIVCRHRFGPRSPLVEALESSVHADQQALELAVAASGF
jgi:hypothetical protein